jgi:putative tryptophan/tyrosine transport system substrate-binding protein
MKRREFLALIGGTTVAPPFTALAQEAGRSYRIGVLWPFPREAGTGGGATEIFDELRRHGFVENQNLTIEYRAWGQAVEQISEYAVELVKARVDCIVAGGPLAIRVAQQATKTIPIIGITDDMVGAGFVSSMARPDGNTTGVSILATELDGKRQEILAEAVPGLRRMATLADANATATAELDALQAAARARNIELSIHRIATGEEIASAIDQAKASGATALNVLASPMLDANRQVIMDRVATLRLPTIYQWPERAEEGGFAAYGPRLIRILQELLTRQVVQLLRGAKIADIPVEQPTKFELVINLKTADTLGVTVPAGLVARADKVIQ